MRFNVIAVMLVVCVAGGEAKARTAEQACKLAESWIRVPPLPGGLPCTWASSSQWKRCMIAPLILYPGIGSEGPDRYVFDDGTQSDVVRAGTELSAYDAGDRIHYEVTFSAEWKEKAAGGSVEFYLWSWDSFFFEDGSATDSIFRSKVNQWRSRNPWWRGGANIAEGNCDHGNCLVTQKTGDFRVGEGWDFPTGVIATALVTVPQSLERHPWPSEQYWKAKCIAAKPSPTKTPTPTRTPTPKPIRTSTPTPGVCYGDCNGDRRVDISEVISALNGLRYGRVYCPAQDFSPRNGRVDLNEYYVIYNAMVRGCR